MLKIAFECEFSVNVNSLTQHLSTYLIYKKGNSFSDNNPSLKLTTVQEGIAEEAKIVKKPIRTKMWPKPLEQ